jgi:CBS domain-containing membrane protein
VIGSKRDIDHIAEWADATVRAVPRRGSLPGIENRHGFNEWLYARWGNRGNAVYTFTGALLTVLLSAGLAWLLDEPLMFPSLGATAFLLFETPMAEIASPRNTIIGHFVGVAVAYLWLTVFGLTDAPSALETGFTGERAAAVALSVACTGGILRLIRAAHPPAGATTVIVSSGLLTTPEELLVLMAGVALLTVTAGMLNRLLGVPAPLWVNPHSGHYLRLRRRLGLRSNHPFT